MRKKKNLPVATKKKQAPGAARDASLLRRYLEPPKDTAVAGPLAWTPSVPVETGAGLKASPTREYTTKENDED